MMESITSAKVLNLIYAPFVAIMLYLKLDTESISVLALLLSIDMVTGVWKTLRIGQKPTSWRFANGLLSKGVLILVPLVIAVAAKGVHIDITPLVWTIIDALILSEMYSILANIYTIKTQQQTEEFDVMSLILKKIRHFINKALNDE